MAAGTVADGGTDAVVCEEAVGANPVNRARLLMGTPGVKSVAVHMKPECATVGLEGVAAGLERLAADVEGPAAELVGLAAEVEGLVKEQDCAA